MSRHAAEPNPERDGEYTDVDPDTNRAEPERTPGTYTEVAGGDNADTAEREPGEYTESQRNPDPGAGEGQGEYTDSDVPE